MVQYVFDLKLTWATDKVLDKLEGSFGELAVQKHSSNVVERCLKCATEERRNRIVDELVRNPRLDQIMQDPFGNYVTQAALDKSKVAPSLQLLRLQATTNNAFVIDAGKCVR